MELWPQIHALCPEIKFQLVPFENTPENAREILKNLGQNIDVVAGIFDETMLNIQRAPCFRQRKPPVGSFKELYPQICLQQIDLTEQREKLEEIKECQEDFSSAQELRAYIQGYVDCDWFQDQTAPAGKRIIPSRARKPAPAARHGVQRPDHPAHHRIDFTETE